ncbi:DUF4145 domain-containing protein [Aeromonas salmonicida]|uniref:DUF4145 domain-containing protein n=1 Tax=Aeromonas salmonicida TaxID=645 RepID=UPI003D318A4C
MDRTIYKSTFTRTRASDWMCPTCKKGYLRLIDNSFKVHERRYSREAHVHPNWDPAWQENVYSCMLKCNNEQCEEVVANSGTGGFEIDYFYGVDDVPDHRLVSFFRPRFFEPPLAIIDIPINCPATVAQPLQESFRLFFCSPSSSSNNVRIAIEVLLTELGVPTHNKKEERLFLNARLKLLPEKYANFKELLMAIKWLGNAGSHPGSVITIDDVMDAYEIIEHILHELYIQKAKKAKALAEKITNSFKPT